MLFGGVGVRSRSFGSNWRSFWTSVTGWCFPSVAKTRVPAGGTAHVRTREAHVTEWTEGVVVKMMTVYTDIDEGRAAAARLAESRG
jgi:hypothetical protein